MTGLGILAILVLLVLVIAVVAIWVFLAMLPGKIARKRGHPQAEAVNVCGGGHSALRLDAIAGS